MKTAQLTALRVTHSKNVMTVQAGTVGNPGNRRFKNESAFWYALKKTLMSDDFRFIGGERADLVKKIMSKDGHMVGGDHGPYYLRDRKRRYAIIDWKYELRDLAQEFFEKGVVILSIHHWEETK